MRTNAGLFNSVQDAERAATELERRGFSRDGISIVRRDSRGRVPAEASPLDTGKIAVHAGVVAAIAAAVGGTVGLLSGWSNYALPGLGPVLAEGAVMTMLAPALAGAGLGALAGGVIGALYGMGIAEEDAAVYAEGVARGNVLLTVEADEGRAGEVEDVLRAAGAKDIGGPRGEGREETVTSDKDPATIIGDYPPHDNRRRQT